MKKVPYVLLAATIVPAITAVFLRLMEHGGTSEEVAKLIRTTDFVLIAAAVAAWALTLTVAIGCLLVMALKGTFSVADAFHPCGNKQRPQPERD